MNKKHTATIFAILAAALYAINIPLLKILLHQVSPTMIHTKVHNHEKEKSC